MTPRENPYDASQVPGPGGEPVPRPTDGKYFTAPLPMSTMPPGIPFIVANEAAERFSYYGMRGILYVFMTEHLRNSSGALDLMSKTDGTFWYHIFLAAVYVCPVFGALLSDILWGKYRTIIWLSIVYCLGHLALAIDTTRIGLAVGLGLIAFGSGGIKPCVSAHVGDQFGKTNQHLIEKVFGWFYLAINLGSTISIMLTPWLLDAYGPHVAFAVPGILMFVATVVFWMGRYRFAHIPPAGNSFLAEVTQGEGRSVLLRLLAVFWVVPFFWSLYEQSSSTWIEQAKQMDRIVFGVEIKAAQTHSANPILILIFIPLSTFVINPALNRLFRLTALRKVGIGFFVTAATFAIVALLQAAIDRRAESGGPPLHIAWQLIPYITMAWAEVLVSVTCLEFSYTQAPPKLKSVVMAMYFLSVAAGNVVTAVCVKYVLEPLGIEGPDKFWFFTWMMVAAAIAFAAVAPFYRERTYVQQEQPAAE